MTTSDRRDRGLLVGAAAIGFVLVASAQVALGTPSHTQTTTALGGAPRCAIGGDKLARLERVALGSSVGITVTSLARCAQQQGMIVVAAYNSPCNYNVSGPYVEALKPWVRRTDLTTLELGIAANIPPKLLAELTHDEGRLLGALARIETTYDELPRPSGDIPLQEWLAIANDELARGRARDAGTSAEQFILLLAGGDDQDVSLGQPVLDEAERAKAAGVTVFVVSYDCCGFDRLATSLNHWFTYPFYYEPDQRPQMVAVQRALAAIDGTIGPHLVASTTVTDTLPGNMRYVPGSAVPPASWEPSTRTLTWTLPSPSAAVTMTYQVEPLECGRWPANEGARADAVDTDGAHYTYAYPVPTIDVVCATPSPTSTPRSTATTAPTETLAPTDPPARPEVTPTLGAWRIALPVALRESACVPAQQRIDVALVIDASFSMQVETATGRTKLAAATAAAAAFLDELHLAEGDRAAVVWFNETAEVAEGLTSDRQALERALAAIASRQFTRLDLGVRAARLELAGPRHNVGNTPAMIVLTDGVANPVGPDAAVAEATAAKDAGVTMFTIGLGSDLADADLAAMASRP